MTGRDPVALLVDRMSELSEGELYGQETVDLLWETIHRMGYIIVGPADAELLAYALHVFLGDGVSSEPRINDRARELLTIIDGRKPT